ncbi:MAG TPA: DUF4215 domain-containing protein [bacterium]|nr:DUF4215 domain-containing protein [bacterium]
MRTNKVFLGIAGLCFVLWGRASGAATFDVDRFDDTAAATACTAAANDCSLRGAIIAANGNFLTDTINLQSGTYTLSVASTCDGDFGSANGDLDIVDDVAINGSTTGQTIIDGGDIDRVFDLLLQTPGAFVATFNDLTIRNGTAMIGTSVCSPGAEGGGIRVGSNTAAELNRVLVVSNNASNGGGVRAIGNITMINSTVSGNVASGDGGGVAAESGSDFRNVTITANSAGGDAGGLLMTTDAGTINVRNSIIAGNTDTSGGNNPDCGNFLSAGTITSEGFNLIGNNSECTPGFITATGDQIGTPAAPINPQLGPLANNGGPTNTHLPLTGSRAIDLANPAGCFSNDANNGSALTVDQRSFTRPLDGDLDGNARCDVGAVEVGCGNGVVETTEGCDDGNAADGDGCTAECVLESCGDGTVQSPEGCDDGNTDDGDGCNANCILETCGNGAVDAGEDCDDGNTVNTDACTNACLSSACGDGFVQGAEDCDDGNTDDGDGCSATCTDEVVLLGDGGCGLIQDGRSERFPAVVMILLMSLAVVATLSLNRRA